MNKKQLPTGVRVLLGFVSVILCIALFACTLVTMLVADVGLLTSKNGIQQLIKDIFFTTSAPARPAFAPAGILHGRNPVRMNETENLAGFDFGDIDFEAILAGENVAGALVDAFFDAMDEEAIEELPFTKEDVTSFVEESTIPEFISDKVAGIVSDVILGESTTTITKEDVMNLLEENKTLIEDTFKVEVPEEVIQEVGAMLEENNVMESIQEGVQSIVGSEIAPPANSPDDSNQDSSTGKPSSGTSNNVSAGMELMDSITKGEVDEFGISEVLVMVRFIASPTVLYSCIAACLILIALLFLTNWGRPYAALISGGIPLLLAGSLLTTPVALFRFAPELIPFSEAERFVAVAIQKVLSMAGYISIGVTALGLVMIVGGIVLGVFMKNRAADDSEITVSSPATETASLSDALLTADVPADSSAENTNV